MKVLFISSGNTKEGISPIVKRQGDSLIAEGVDLQYFTIKGKGILGYLSNLSDLRQVINEFQPDILHAHYSLSAFLATITKAKPIVVSLMGSDVKSAKWYKIVLWFYCKFFWDITIVKSHDMESSLGFNNLHVIPNGVNTNIFYSMSKLEAQNKLNRDKNKTNILFAANPKRAEKNYSLAKEAVSLLDKHEMVLHSLEDVQPELIPIWLNASDVIILTSLWEGSPNVIKEAMACNRPIVSTDVGDVKWIFGETEGCYICEFSSADLAQKINLALNFLETKGRDRIIDLELDSFSIAKRIIKIYEKLV
jgi:teichuronic acid biosynthesis glycosyltransferase TuaC